MAAVPVGSYRVNRPRDPRSQTLGHVASDDHADRVKAAAETALRRAAEVEVALVRMHQQAAELYESWLQQDRSQGATNELARRAQTHRERMAALWSVDGLIERALTSFEGRAVA